MTRKIMIAAAALLAISMLVTTVFGSAGTVSDPFVSLSFLEEIFVKPANEQLSKQLSNVSTHVSEQLDAAVKNQADYVERALNEALTSRVYARVAQKVASGSSLNIGTMQKVSLEKGDRIVGTPGAGIMLLSGAASTYGSQSSVVINITAGETRVADTPLGASNYYMIAADDGSGIIVTSERAEFYVREGARVLKAYTPVHTARADTLKSLGLFVGTANGYELDRPPTRQEALIMLIRLLGEEQAALDYTGQSAFTDLAGWAEGRRYIAYGHAKGYTNGENATTFAQYKFATLEMYLTFVLRSLGYSDTAGDFVWNTTSKTLAADIGLLTSEDLTKIEQTGIMRDHVVQISLNALFVNLKGQSTTLGQKLVAAGVISAEAFAAVNAGN